MLAELKLTMGPRTVVALLGEDFMWRSEDLLTQSYLNACYAAEENEDTLTLGPPGYRQATRAAKGVEQAGWDVNLYIPALNQSAA